MKVFLSFEDDFNPFTVRIKQGQPHCFAMHDLVKICLADELMVSILLWPQYEWEFATLEDPNLIISLCQLWSNSEKMLSCAKKNPGALEVGHMLGLFVSGW